MTQHKPGVHEQYLMVRHIRIDPASQKQQDEIVSGLESVIGVDDVAFNTSGDRLNISYDTSVENIDHVLHVLETHGCVVHHSWVSDFKLDWYKFVDENAHDNATRTPWSCHQPPPVVRRKVRKP